MMSSGTPFDRCFYIPISCQAPLAAGTMTSNFMSFGATFAWRPLMSFLSTSKRTTFESPAVVIRSETPATLAQIVEPPDFERSGILPASSAASAEDSVRATGTDQWVSLVMVNA